VNAATETLPQGWSRNRHGLYQIPSAPKPVDLVQRAKDRQRDVELEVLNKSWDKRIAAQQYSRRPPKREQRLRSTDKSTNNNSQTKGDN
jgi:hypothetical protein